MPTIPSKLTAWPRRAVASLRCGLASARPTFAVAATMALLAAESVSAETLLPDTLVTVSRAAEALGISRTLAFQLVAEGKLRSIKIGRARRVPASEITRFIEAALAEQEAVR